MTKRKVHAYIDADVSQYRATSFCLSDWEGTPAADIGQAAWCFREYFLDRWLDEASKTVDITGYTLCFTTKAKFRKELYPDYKANRKDLEVWPGMWRFKTELLSWLESEHEEGLEADDLIGIRVTEDPENRIVISADKDFLTLPVTLFVPTSHGIEHGWFRTTEAQANLNLFRQAIIGDVADNYKGIVGFGAVKAEKAIPQEAPVETLWAQTKAAFLAKGYTEEYALTMVRLARILRAGEYDFETKEVKLWSPK